jgi:hypothetical protein
MKHSVLCRAQEVAEWVGMEHNEMTARLEREHAQFLAALDDAPITEILKAQGARNAAHLPRWARALSMS